MYFKNACFSHLITFSDAILCVDKGIALFPVKRVFIKVKNINKNYHCHPVASHIPSRHDK